MINGQYLPVLDLDITPKLDAVAALQKLSLAMTGDKETLVANYLPVLGIYEEKTGHRLVYYTMVHYTDSNGVPHHSEVYFDANDASLVLEVNRNHGMAEIQTRNYNGYCQQQMYAAANTQTESQTEVKDASYTISIPPVGGLKNRNGSGLALQTMQESIGEGMILPAEGTTQDTSGAYPYINAEGEEVTAFAATGDTSSQDPEVQVRGFLENSYWFYKQVFNRSSYDNQDGRIRATVMATFPSQNGQCSGLNAFADPDSKELMFGTGDSRQNINPMSSGQDIVAHEFTHLVTATESNLNYNGESGALNEALSDMFGVTIQSWAESGGSDIDNPSEIKITQNTWILGEALDAESWERYMDNPTKDGRSYDNYNDRGTANSCSQQNDNCFVHTNSGIYNLSYALLAGGGTHPKGKSDISVPGIGLEKASRIWYEAQINTIGSRTGFSAVRNSVKTAATGVYGECSPEYKSVMLSLDAVLIPGTWECTEPDTIAPTIVSITPVSNATNLSVEPTIKVKFSEPIKNSSVNSSTVVLKDALGTNIVSTLNVNGETISIIPNSALAYGSVYTINISGVTDMAENTIETAFSSSFTTKVKQDNSDIVPPEVLSYTPESNAVDISVDSNIEIIFSEEVTLESLESALTIKSQSGANVNISISIVGEQVTITPDSPLRDGTKYTVNLSNTVKDLNDNTLSLASTWEFTTYEEAEETPTKETTLSGASITSGSYYNNSYVPQNTIDGNEGTSWVSQTLTNGYYQSDFIQVAFDTPKSVNNIYIDWHSYYYAREMEVWVYAQNQWHRLGTQRKASPGITSLPIKGEVSAIYISMRGGNRGSWFVINSLSID